MVMASQGNIAANSRLTQMQMKFQRRQLLEREQKKNALMGDEGSDDTSLGSKTITKGKVRQMFDERRRGAGIDRSNPLKPITLINTQTATKSNTLNNNNNNNNSTRRPVITNSRKNSLITQKTMTKTTANGRHTFGKGELFNFDALEDDLNNEAFPREFSDLSLKNTPANGKVNGDRNNNRMAGDQGDGKRGNSIKLNPVIVKKSPNIATIRTPSNSSRATSSPVIGTTATIHTTPRMNGHAANKSAGGTTKITTKTTTITGARPATFNMAAKPAPRVATPPPGMGICRYCQRHFNEDRLPKHEDVCKKMINTKRKVFDATSHRVRGTEAEVYIKKPATRVPSNASAARYSSAAAANNLKMEPNQAVKKSNWRKKHEEFIAAIREAKKVQAHLARGGKLSDLPPPPPSDNSDYIQCPHCGRRFNEDAAERHIPKCANMRHNKPKPGQTANVKRR